MSLLSVREQIVACTRCPRLRDYCARIGREKKAAHRDDVYWAKPVPGFGDPMARLLIVGLAPAAHGANRTGRVFTGDGPGGSGDFLMSAMHAHGFANLPTTRHVGDGLVLTDAFIAAAVRCAPPQNKPTREEIEQCRDHLRAEIAALPRIALILALGKIAYDACWTLLKERGVPLRPRPPFGHGVAYTPGPGVPGLLTSYHPSRQNTNTGKLTHAMMREVFHRARRALDALPV